MIDVIKYELNKQKQFGNFFDFIFDLYNQPVLLEKLKILKRRLESFEKKI